MKKAKLKRRLWRAHEKIRLLHWQMERQPDAVEQEKRVIRSELAKAIGVLNSGGHTATASHLRDILRKMCEPERERA